MRLTTSSRKLTSPIRYPALAVAGLIIPFACGTVLAAAGTPIPPTKIIPSTSEARDEFGFSMSLAGNTLLVGAPRRDSRASDSGAAYVFEHQSARHWVEVAELAPADLAAGDSFGWSVAVAGNTAIVGSRGDDDRGNNAGSAYIFERDEGGVQNWGQVRKLYASDPAPADQFGYAVAVSGNTAVVGAWAKDGFGGDRAGAAYVFERDQGGPNNWGQVTKLTPSAATGYDLFGYSVAISGDSIVIGAPADDNFGSQIGSAFFYQRDNNHLGGWRETLKLTPSDSTPLNKFGGSVAISGETALIGAFWDNENGARAGAAYVFEQDGLDPDQWNEIAKLAPANPAAHEWFGISVALSGDSAVVGAWWDQERGSQAGAAYAYQRHAGGPNNWGETAKILGEDTAPFNYFGHSVAASGFKAAAGAYGAGQAGNGAGRAYAFYVPEPSTLLLVWSVLVTMCMRRVRVRSSGRHP